ncbi:restriction endonuclease subunit S, partial [Levilactobacillus brevis]|nr:restriction endonuclease subunit S [Levilactobacillus brevis]
MNDNQTKYPQLRFKGFTDPWEKRKLGEVADKVTEKNKTGEYTEVLTNSAEYGIISQSDFFDKEIANVKNIGGYYVVEPDDFVYNPRISNSAPVGPVKRNKLKRIGIMSPLYFVLRPHDIDQGYLEYYFSTKKWHRFMELNGDTGARSDRFAIKDAVFVTMPIPFPNIKEQTKIGTFFATLDHLIAVNQRKLAKLKELKQGYLQKLFPRNGSKFPQLRFAGFADAWEQRKLSEIYDKIRNAFVGTATPYYVNQGHFYLESNNVKYGKLNFNNEVYINDDFYQKQKPNWLHTGDLVVVQSGHVGHSAVIPSELNNTAAHAVIIVAKPKQKIDPYFINDYLQTNIARKQIDNITTGNTIKHILASAMKMFEVSLPSYEEQHPISNLLAQIDDTITLHQRKL